MSAGKCFSVLELTDNQKFCQRGATIQISCQVVLLVVAILQMKTLAVNQLPWWDGLLSLWAAYSSRRSMCPSTSTIFLCCRTLGNLPRCSLLVTDSSLSIRVLLQSTISLLYCGTTVFYGSVAIVLRFFYPTRGNSVCRRFSVPRGLTTLSVSPMSSLR